ncbi:hypothetical protein C8R44DRAFT_873336 [Mycena epipterygia]|nr:hypothetical protein C8R44DRAFT_873336 [Mycena epipterygia]
MAPSHLNNSGLALRAAIKRVEINEIGADVGAQAGQAVGDAVNADPDFPTSAKIALMVAGLVTVAFLVLVYLKLRSRPKTVKAQYTAQKLEESDGD